MAFKQNLPVLLGLALLAVGLVALALIFQKPEEQRLHDAAAQYAATLGPARDVTIHGSVVDLSLANGSILYAEFVNEQGAWKFSKDVGKEFERVMQDPAATAAILKNLAQRIADRFAMPVTIKDPNLSYQYLVRREGADLLGQVLVYFAYPKQGDQQRHGGYREVFRYANGAWTSDGPGALFDRLPKPAR